MLIFSAFLINLISSLDLNKYNSYNDIDEWLEEEGASVLTTTLNGRNLRLFEKSSDENQKKIMIDCGKGARKKVKFRRVIMV
jgi:hypothetical protein